jgi:hypothetical protein
VVGEVVQVWTASCSELLRTSTPRAPESWQMFDKVIPEVLLTWRVNGIDE